ncbi:flavoprotein-like protein [Xylogone sp. PMI_703]|nr:flavoprotein-like protein [Xylogone sp. PMI_703]
MGTINVALIICSTRTPRIGPAIAAYLLKALLEHTSASTRISILDLADYPLPISPQGITLPADLPYPLPPNPYSTPEVNTWSAAVSSYDGYVFLTPQYNWSFPASIKVAIDHIYHEWKEKPALIVSYGGRGGGKAAAHLREVCKGLKMDPWEGQVELPLVVEGKMLGVDENGNIDKRLAKAWEQAGRLNEVVEKRTEMDEILRKRREKL